MSRKIKSVAHLLCVASFIVIASCQNGSNKNDMTEFSDTLIIEDISGWSRTRYHIKAHSVSKDRREGYTLYSNNYEGSSIEELTTARPNKRVAVKLRIEPYNNMLSITGKGGYTFNITELGTGEIVKTVKGRLFIEKKPIEEEDNNEPESMYVETSDGAQIFFQEYIRKKGIINNIYEEVTVTYTSGNSERISYIKVLEN